MIPFGTSTTTIFTSPLQNQSGKQTRYSNQLRNPEKQTIKGASRFTMLVLTFFAKKMNHRVDRLFTMNKKNCCFLLIGSKLYSVDS